MFHTTLIREPLRPVEGTYAVPTGPGWGVTIDRDARDDHLAAQPVSTTIDDIR